MKKTAATILCLVLILCSWAACFGDGNYTLDPITGDIVSTDSGENLSSGSVRVSTDCIYNKKTQMYIFSTTADSSSEVYCSVYDGEVTTDTVTLTPGQGALITIYKDGTAIKTDQSSYIISSPGFYVVRRQNSDEEVLRFTIVNTVTGALQSITLPDVFMISSVTYEGTMLGNGNKNTVDLTDEGDYKINYKCTASGVSRTLKITVDHTAPELYFSGVTDGIAQGPVTVTRSEQGGTLEVTLNGEPYTMITDTVKTFGNYTFTFTDEAGNSNVYEFTMRVFLDLSAWFVIGAVVLIIALAVGYMIYSRKHLRTC